VNSDDKLLPGAIASLVSVFGEAQQALLAYGDVVVIDERSNKVGDLRSGPWDPPTMTRTGANPIVQQASLWRREAWEAAGPFDEGSFYWFEFEFWLKLSAHGEGVHLDRPLAAYRLHPRSKTVSALAGRAEDSIRFADGFLAGPDLPAELRPYARRGRASHYWRAGFALYQAGEIRRARRALLHALALDPRVLSPLLLLILAKSLAPEPIVRRRRAARR
jgi:hypothetical protein